MQLANMAMMVSEMRGGIRREMPWQGTRYADPGDPIGTGARQNARKGSPGLYMSGTGSVRILRGMTESCPQRVTGESPGRSAGEYSVCWVHSNNISTANLDPEAIAAIRTLQ
jgi:hypothetical protein